MVSPPSYLSELLHPYALAQVCGPDAIRATKDEAKAQNGSSLFPCQVVSLERPPDKRQSHSLPIFKTCVKTQYYNYSLFFDSA